MADASDVALCIACGTQLASGMLACPSCGSLLHAARLRQLASAAEAASGAGDVAQALQLWRTAITLLPAETRQHGVIVGKIEQLSRMAESAPASFREPSPIPATAATPLPPLPTARTADRRAGPVWRETKPPKKKSALGAVGAALGVVGLVVWKLKAVVVLALTKGKFLLLGLTKGSTLLSMLASMGIYWTLFGWKFAVGLVVSIYIHEMGHVFTLQRYGIKATAPMFIPGFGAMIRLKQYPTLPREDAMVGLAGPLWGLGAALAAWGISLATGLAAFAAIAQVGAWINLFNLLPVWQLDGSRGFRALARWQRLVVAGLFGGAFAVTHDGLLLLLAIVAAGVSLATRPAVKSDNDVLAYFAVLIAALAGLTQISVPLGAL